MGFVRPPHPPLPVLATLTLLAGAACQLPALAQPNVGAPVEAQPEITLDTLIERQLEAEFLSDDEKKDLRIAFGRFTPDDLDTPARRARAALLVRALDDPSLSDASVPVEDRAEGARLRGEIERALELLEGADSTRANRIRVEALYDLGRSEEAADACDPIVERLTSVQVTDADELVDGVLALIVRARIEGSGQTRGGDYRTLLSLIGRARDELAPLSYRVRLAEARLLYEKHNLTEASDAAREALARNPYAVDAIALLGRLAVDGLNADGVEAAAMQAETLQSAEGPLGDLVGEDGVPLSVASQINRARMSLRQNLSGVALADLEPVLDRYPGHRGALALRAAASAMAYDDGVLDASLERFYELSPGSALADYEIGSALAEARQYDLAPNYLDRTIEIMPNWSAPKIDLGLMLLQDARDEVAMEQLSAAVELDPFNRRARNSLRLGELVSSMERLETEHFEIRWEPGPDELLAREMGAVMERIHERVAGPTGLEHEPARKTVLELMPTHERFAVRITGSADLHTMAAATGPLIAFESPRVGGTLRVGPYDWPRVLKHEYVHTVSLSRTRNRLPHWFTEACAVYHEDAPRDESTWTLLLRAHQTGTLFDLEAINLAFARPKKPTDRAQAYAQGHWMYQFIVDRWDRTMPLRLMDAYAEGEPEVEAFERLLGLDSASFLAEFEAWAEADLRAHGLLPAEGVPSVKELVDGLPEGERLDAPQARSWLEDYPGHPGLLEVLVGFELRDRGDVVDHVVEGLLREFAAARPVAELPHRLLARHTLDRGRADDTLAHLEFLDARAQYEPAFATSLAELYAERGLHERAIEKALRATRISPFDPRLRELAARVLLASGDLPGARAQIEALRTLEPDRVMHQKRLDAIDAMIENAS